MGLKLLVTDEMLRLARWLRLMGYDTISMGARPLRQLYRQASKDRRVVITRCRSVKEGIFFRVVHLESQNLDCQLKQLMKELNIYVDKKQQLTRCAMCNTELMSEEKGRLRERVPPQVYERQSEFYTCPLCNRLYWAGSHYDRVSERLRKISA